MRLEAVVCLPIHASILCSVNEGCGARYLTPTPPFP